MGLTLSGPSAAAIAALIAERAGVAIGNPTLDGSGNIVMSFVPLFYKRASDGTYYKAITPGVRQTRPICPPFRAPIRPARTSLWSPAPLRSPC